MKLSSTVLSMTLLVSAGAACRSAIGPGHETRPAVAPMGFEMNRGQTDPSVKYVARGSHYLAFFLDTEIVLSFSPPASGRGAAIRMRLMGANTNAHVRGERELPRTVSYFIGNKSSQWQAGVPSYESVRYRAVYPGIDLVFYGNPTRLEHDFQVAPGADPGAIAWEISGADHLELTSAGDLRVRAGDIDVSFAAPILYQEANGSREIIDGGYQLREPNRVQFHVGRYDARRPLVIDPFLEYSTYIGGSNTDRSFAPAIDAAGNVYVTGTTGSLDFPTIGSFQARNAGALDVFVTKLSRNGSTILYSVYLGGGGVDRGFGIATNSEGEVYVSGDTTSSDFPTLVPTQGFGGGQDAFVAKLTDDGTALVYSTFLGGTAIDSAFDVRLDVWDEAIVAGTTESQDFPTRDAIQPASGGARDIFVAKMRADGSLRYSTYLGGSSNEGNGAIWLDFRGHVFVAGSTASTDFPIVKPLQAAYGGGGNDAFVSKIDAGGAALLFSTYLGGSGIDIGFAVTVDRHDNAAITGRTNSSNFPTVNPLQARLAGGNDIFVAKIKGDLSGYEFATYLGGSGDENAFGITVDGWGNVHLSGWTNSTNFPTVNAMQPRNAGGDDAVFAAIDPTGSKFVYSTYFGGSAEDRGDYIVADPAGRTYASGWTASADFPTYLAMQPRYGGGMYDAFVVHFSP